MFMLPIREYEVADTRLRQWNAVTDMHRPGRPGALSAADEPKARRSGNGSNAVGGLTESTREQHRGDRRPRQRPRGLQDAACPLSTRGGTRLVRVVRGGGGEWLISEIRAGRSCKEAPPHCRSESRGNGREEARARRGVSD